MKNLETEQFKNLFKNILKGNQMNKNMAQEYTYGGGGDEVDKLNFNQEKELKSKLVNRNSHYLKKVKYALDKIHNKSFGTCEDCETDISAGRLKARPTATLCIECKEENEKVENHTFDSSNVIDLHTRKISFGKNIDNDPFKQNVQKLDNGEIRVLV